MSKSYLQADAAALRWWRQGRFGMFIHWGPVSLVGTEISWSRGVAAHVNADPNPHRWRR
jgi:alpha-L-fucosidase